MPAGAPPNSFPTATFALQHVAPRADNARVEALGVEERRASGVGTITPSRVGRLLRSGRRRQGLSLRAAAVSSGIDRQTLAAYEHGWDAVPDDDLLVLARMYGGTVAGLVPLRLQDSGGRHSSAAAGSRVRILAGRAGGAMLDGYVQLVRELRGARPGDPLPLRTHDLEALAEAIGTDTDDVEARIVEILGCSATVAATLHRELLRRRILTPVAGLAFGVAAFGGLTSPVADPRPLPAGVVIHASQAAADATISAGPTTSAAPAPTTTGAPAASSTTTVSEETTTTTAATAPQPVAAAPAAPAPVTAATTAPPQTPPPDGGILPGETATPAPAPTSGEVATDSPGDPSATEPTEGVPDVGILPGETATPAG